MFLIGEIAKKFNLSISAIRYYDKMGLLKFVKKENGIRKFDDRDVETIYMIECLKKSGLTIKEIKEFLDWVAMGDGTLQKRLDFFETQQVKVEKEILELQKILDLIKFKTWYYSEAVKKGTDKNLLNIESMPESIKQLYINSHS